MGYLEQKAVCEIIATLHSDDRENIKQLFCECYCKFTDEYMAMYKDVDEAMENLMREKCEMCPLNEVIG